MPAAVGRAPSTGLHLLHIAADLLESEPDAAPESTQTPAPPPAALPPTPSVAISASSSAQQIGALDILLRAASASNVSLESGDSSSALASSLSAADASNSATPSALPRNKAYLKFQSSLSSEPSSALATEAVEPQLALSTSTYPSNAEYASQSQSQVEQYAGLSGATEYNRLASLDAVNIPAALDSAALPAKVRPPIDSFALLSTPLLISQVQSGEPPSLAAPAPPQKKKVTLSEYKTRRQQSNAPSSVPSAASEFAQPAPAAIPAAAPMSSAAEFSTKQPAINEPESLTTTPSSASDASLEPRSVSPAAPAPPMDSLAASIVNVLQKTGHSSVLANLGKSLFRAPLANPSVPTSQSQSLASPSPSSFLPPFTAPSSSLLSALATTSPRDSTRSPLTDPLAASAVEHQPAAHASPHTPTQDDEEMGDGPAVSPNGPLADSSALPRDMHSPEPTQLAVPIRARPEAPAAAEASPPPSDKQLAGPLEQLHSEATPLLRPQTLPT